MAKVTDPDKKPKKKIIINGATFSSDTTRKVKTGSAARLERDEKGNIRQIKGKDFAGLTPQMILENQAVIRRAQQGDKSFSSQPAPRTGGKVDKMVTPKGTSNKKLIIRSIKKSRKSDASPAAKRAAIRIHKN